MVKKVKKTKKFTKSYLVNKIANGEKITRRDMRKYIKQCAEPRDWVFGEYWYVDLQIGKSSFGECGMPGPYENAMKLFMKDIPLYLDEVNGVAEIKKANLRRKVLEKKSNTIPTEIMIEAQAEAEAERKLEAEREHKMEVQMERGNY